MNRVHRLGFWCLWILACLSISACGRGSGERSAPIAGKVLSGGKPVPIEHYEKLGNCVHVEFFPLDASGNVQANKRAWNTVVKEDGSFAFGGEGIPEGKYRVAVTRVDASKGGGDVWKGKYGRDKSTFTASVPSQGDLVIDLPELPK
jgi:hypothetical protein